MNTVFVKRYADDFPVNRREIWRYAGFQGQPDKTLNELLDMVIADFEGMLSYRICYRKFCDLPFGKDSKDLEKALRGSKEFVVFGATIGLEIDRYIAKFQHISATRALLAQAYGAERIEALCDAFCKEFSGRTRRFSPGYGDLPLESQKEIFALLDCGKHIGVGLSGRLLMTPSKSVTAIFGIGEEKENCVEKCEFCGNSECNYRR
jgi:hypothetical protein